MTEKVAPFTYWAENDGGRAEAGFKGDANDCVARSVAIVTQRPYADVYKELAQFMKDNGLPKSARNSIPTEIVKAFMKKQGFTWVPTMTIGSGTTVHLRADELPHGRIIARVTRHVCAVVDGVIEDTYDPSRGGTRAVYGYWKA